MIARVIAASLAVMLATSGGAWACHAGNGKAALDDSFSNPDPGWGPPDDAASFTATGLVLKPPVNGSAWRWNQNFTMDGADLCVSVENPAVAPGQQDSGDVGVRFWAQDAMNFYTATVSLNGTVAIDELVSGVWHPILRPTPSNAVQTAAGAVNQIEVVVRGNRGSFFVNGRKVADFTGAAPARGGPPGVYAESGKTPETWVFPRVQLF